ncbi:Na/Pi cotransporter family protein [Aliarcobacter skirrowii]|uniref:Na/Pi cotransporter family protein n=1 Tax=Aliarcobacter skirrowii TaxID=28200 RepID=A0A2U2C2I3_9BACT|nr:Na/Pi symporter [Aliarcobacter skirrowii]PWE22879.1 Na/Pi cotransporter family protein [Aliarcobacter skirrowii]PWE23245.1 Na/Pi cotransporter family protein [Aliarcobacter skirrowii]PWE26115.1 Na/Pi cotransporter family protein [Aliarcobacter skirrowii]RJO56472.1 Na/Pi cotransporter family protein [Aliarcobacter skirrowii]RJO58426.1 Na/Pi cotransporter family protein [Aliarcobacter skirrowii]
MKKYLSYILLISLAYLLYVNEDSKYIVAGVAVFIIGMQFMEDGFKFFSGGILEKLIANSTNTNSKAIFLGITATAILQSSSLIAIIVISFLSAKIISLAGALGVVFGSAVGTTATTWIVSTLGVKIDIAAFALPMVIFGVIFRFYKDRNFQGFGNILLGLGFVFLGIGYMKDGFEDLKQGINLAQFAIDGYLGIIVYTLIGAFATVIIQSSSATMALTVTALVTGQIVYINAMAIAVGANIGTATTAALGAIVSNANSKRMAVGLFIFKGITAVITLASLYLMIDFVDYISKYLGIKSDDWAMKLAVFHTLFNLVGLLIFSFFIPKLVIFLKKLFVEEKDSYITKPKFLDMEVVAVPFAALKATRKETIHLYDNASEVLSHAIMLHRHRYIGKSNISKIVKESSDIIDLNIDEFYESRIKSLYSDIIDYSTYFINELDDEKKLYLNDLRNACRDIAESVKNTKELQKNVRKYISSNNSYIKDEYNFIREAIAKTINTINEMKNSKDDIDVLSKSELLKEYLKGLDVIATRRIDILIREKRIDKKMATTLLNDSYHANLIISRLISVSKVLWIQDLTIKELGED